MEIRSKSILDESKDADIVNKLKQTHMIWPDKKRLRKQWVGALEQDASEDIDQIDPNIDRCIARILTTRLKE